jgi:hypothetical protein
MLWFFKIFSPKNSAKILAFFAQTATTIWKKIDHDIGFWEKRHFFAENSQKSQVITSTPDWANFRLLGGCFLWAVFFNWRRGQNIWATF